MTISGVEYVCLLQELASVPAAALGAAVETLSSRRPDFIAALDLLFTGS